MAAPRRLCLLAGLALTLASGWSHAQEAALWVDPLGSVSVRALGLGGAFAGLADDSTSALLNPAGLTTLPRSLEALGGLGIDYDGGLSLAGASAGFRPDMRVGAGLHWAHPVGLELRPTGFMSGGALPLASFQDLAFGAAVTIARPGEFSFGGALRVSQLKSDGLEQAPWAPSFTTGLLFRPLNPWSPRIGLSYRHRLKWQVAGGGGRAPLDVLSPSVASAGVSWYYEPERRVRLLLTLQSDLVRYSELTSDTARLEGARDDFDFRTATEVTVPFGCWTGCGSMVQFRFAVVNYAPAPFVVRLSTPGEAAGQGPGRSWDLAAGFTLGLKWGYGRFKLDMAWDGRTETVAAGLGWRFPQAFRAGIVDNTRR